MSTYDKALITLSAVSLILVAVAVPLALRMVPRNGVYGFRTRATMSNSDLWFSGNAYFGRCLIVTTTCGWLLAVAAYVFRPLPAEAVVPASVLFMVLPGLVSTLVTLRYVRRRRATGKRTSST